MPIIPTTTASPSLPPSEIKAMQAYCRNQIGRTTASKELLPAVKKYGAERVWKVLRYLSVNQNIANWWLFHLEKEFLEYEKRVESSLFEYPITGWAKTVRCYLDSDDTIPLEYVQHCIDEYRAFAYWLQDLDSPTATEILDKLPPCKEFALVWFGHVRKSWKPTPFRKFGINTAEFIKFLQKLMEGVVGAKTIDSVLEKYNASRT